MKFPSQAEASIYRTRRTVKPAGMDPSREVARELLETVLEDAHWAPTHGLTQPWRFHVFASQAARQKLADGLVGIYDQETQEGARNPEKRTKLSAGPLRAPAVIALLARVEPRGKIAEWEEIAATSCAAQNLMLSAHEKGLATFWASPPAACSAAFVRWLGLDEAHRALGLIYLGWPLAGMTPPSSTRVPLGERVSWY